MTEKIASWWLGLLGRFDEYMVPLDDDVDGRDGPTVALDQP